MFPITGRPQYTFDVDPLHLDLEKVLPHEDDEQAVHAEPPLERAGHVPLVLHPHNVDQFQALRDLLQFLDHIPGITGIASQRRKFHSLLNNREVSAAASVLR